VFQQRYYFTRLWAKCQYPFSNFFNFLFFSRSYTETLCKTACKNLRKNISAGSSYR